jgi:hypothetical protein
VKPPRMLASRASSRGRKTLGEDMETEKRLPASVRCIRPLAWCLLSFLLATGVSAQPNAPSAAASATSTITWQSLNSTFNEVPAEFAKLYRSLADFG